MRIVVYKSISLCVVNAVMGKEGHYYYVAIQNTYHTEVINTNVQNVKDIYNSLERK